MTADDAMSSDLMLGIRRMSANIELINQHSTDAISDDPLLLEEPRSKRDSISSADCSVSSIHAASVAETTSVRSLEPPVEIVSSEADCPTSPQPTTCAPSPEHRKLHALTMSALKFKSDNQKNSLPTGSKLEKQASTNSFSYLPPEKKAFSKLVEEISSLSAANSSVNNSGLKGSSASTSAGLLFSLKQGNKAKGNTWSRLGIHVKGKNLVK